MCDPCGPTRPAYHVCRNHHCPKCQARAAARWVDARRARLLPTPYCPVVFTLPAALRGLVRHNRRHLFALLCAAASQTWRTLGRDPRRLGATLGITAVLHTWTRDLQFHPHAHCLVTGGGLAVERPRWIAARPRHLLPVTGLSRLFRGKFLAALARARARACGEDQSGPGPRPEAVVHRLVGDTSHVTSIPPGCQAPGPACGRLP